MKTFLLADILSALGIFIMVIGSSTSGVLLLLKGTNAYFDRREQKRIDFLRDYTFPLSCYAEVQLRYPHLTAEKVEIAFDQLRLYFEVCLVYSSPDSSRLVAMPSKLVDVCWHSFITETRGYQAFCKLVFGGFFHHESKVNTSFPLIDISVDEVANDAAAKLSVEAKDQRELDFKHQLSAARIYHWTLAISGVKSSPETNQAPLLFSIDQEFSIEDGYFYSPKMLEFLAKFDLKTAEAVVKKRETDAAGGSAAACGDGGSCGGCGGSV
jgi:hypothetical protein